MKKHFLVVLIFAGLLLIDSCTSCYTCTRDDLEARCIKPNDTLVFNQNDAWTGYVRRYYAGGDSATCIYIGGTFEAMEQKLINDGYQCSIHPLGHRSELRICGNNDSDIRKRYEKQAHGYFCKEKLGL